MNFINKLAIAANALALIAAFLLTQEVSPHRLEEYLTVAAIFALPLVNLVALVNLPDREEKQLRRKVAKAELRYRLKELGVSEK